MLLHSSSSGRGAAGSSSVDQKLVGLESPHRHIKVKMRSNNDRQNSNDRKWQYIVHNYLETGYH